MLHPFPFAAVPENFSRFRIRKLDLKGKTSAELDLMKEKLNRIGSGHAQRGKDSFRLGFDGGSDPSPNRGSLSHASSVAQM